MIKMSVLIFLLFLGSCVQSGDFRSALEQKGYIVTNKVVNFLDKEAQLLEIKDDSELFVAYYVIPINQVDSMFIKEKTLYYTKQSCATLNQSPSIRFSSFEHNSNYFIIKECSECSDVFNTNCKEVKQNIIDIIKTNNYQVTTW